MATIYPFPEMPPPALLTNMCCGGQHPEVSLAARLASISGPNEVDFLFTCVTDYNFHLWS